MSLTLALIALPLIACRGDDEDGRGDTGLEDTGLEDTGLHDTGGQDAGAQEAPPGQLVPLPAEAEIGETALTLDDTTTIVTSAEGEAVAELLAACLRPPTGLALEVVLSEDPEAAEGVIRLVLDQDASDDDEGYSLTIDQDGVRLAARAPAGLFYGTQTLRQLLPAAAFAPELQDGVSWDLPQARIQDAPAYPWRGGMIDVARHFFDAEAVRRQVDLFALHKLNRLHLHLTDDQGWRIEIQSWPDLAIIGGATEVGAGVGGYYTQDEYEALVAYAAARFITVVPEVDVPGHSNAALASYGELNADGEPADPYTDEAVLTAPLDLDLAATWVMVEDVFTELAAITPGPYLHVGGDEAIDLSTADYADFLLWLQGVVTEGDKFLIGWDEIGEADLEPPYISQYWWQQDLATRATAGGAELIYSYAAHCYLDMVYDYDAEYGQTWAGAIDIEQAYGCRPTLEGVSDSRLIGVEAPLWTEYIDTQDKLDFMLWPRLSAIAEVGWTPHEALDWADLRSRLPGHGRRLEAIGVNYNPTDEVDWD